MATKPTDQTALANQLQTKADNKDETAVTVRSLLGSPVMKKRFEEVLKQRAPQYMASILNLYNSDTQIQQCEPMTVVASCMVAATLDLPVDKNLGYAWIVPYKNKATFQMGYKGYIQLALRTGLYRKINAIPVYEGELVNFDPLTEELVIDFSKRKADKIIGYAGYFELINGFKKSVYWSRERIETHRKRFSKSDFGWNKDYDGMALKTVIRNMLSKWGILSVEMQNAYSKEFDTKVEHGEEDKDEPIDIDFSVIQEDATTEETDAPETTETIDLLKDFDPKAV